MGLLLDSPEQPINTPKLYISLALASNKHPIRLCVPAITGSSSPTGYEPNQSHLAKDLHSAQDLHFAQDLRFAKDLRFTTSSRRTSRSSSFWIIGGQHFALRGPTPPQNCQQRGYPGVAWPAAASTTGTEPPAQASYTPPMPPLRAARPVVFSSLPEASQDEHHGALCWRHPLPAFSCDHSARTGLA